MKSIYKLALQNRKTKGLALIEPLCYRVSKDKNGKCSAVFSLTAELCHQMRWIDGDRIDVLYDPSQKTGQLIRCKQGGWALSGRKEGERKRISLCWFPETGLPDKSCDVAHQTTDSTIVFTF